MTARLPMLWMIGGSWKSANKKTEKIHFSVKCYLGWRQKCCVGKTGNGTVTQSEESITPMTSYRLPSLRVIDPSHSFRMTFNVLYKDHGVGRQKELWRT